MMDESKLMSGRAKVKRAIVFVVLAVVSNLLVANVAQGKVPAATKVQKAIKDLEARRFKATVDADVEALGPLLAEDMTYSHSSGVTQTKTEFMDGIRQGELRYEEIRPDVLEVRAYGNTAVVVGRVHMKTKTKGQESTIDLHFLDVYVKRKGRWQMVAWQSTKIPQ